MVLLPNNPLLTRLIRVACIAALGLLLAACSGDNVRQVERAVEPTPIPVPSGVGPNGEELTLEVLDGGDATGLIISDHRGFAVYGLTGETRVGQPVCVDECLTVWIPLAPRDLAVSTQLDRALLSIWARPDGLNQVVYADVPLYTWTGDSSIGITGGAGVAGTWFALTQTGGFIAES